MKTILPIPRRLALHTPFAQRPLTRLAASLNLLAVPATLLLCGVANADDGAAPRRADAIDEVMVTAQKREEDPQTIPISLAVLDAGELENLGIGNIADIANKVPNFRAVAFPISPSTIRLFIRGVGTNEAQLTTDPGVGVYFNGIYVARSAGLSMDVADLERVEILRGPQGTLYGRNATGGAVNLITAKPTGEFSLKQELSVGSYNYRRSKTQINLPEYRDVSVKLAYIQSSKDGLVKNSGEGRDFGDDDKKGALIALHWAPSDVFSADYIYDWARLNFSAYYYQATDGVRATSGNGFGSLGPNLPFLGGPAVQVPLQKHRVSSATLKDPFEGGDSKISGHTLNLNWELDGIALKSLTGYRELYENAYADDSANPDFTFFKNDPVQIRQHQFSQEFQVIGAGLQDRLQYVGGVYYFNESGSEFEIDRADVAFTPAPVFGDSLIITQRDTKAENTTAAIYGQAAYHFTDAWRVTVGARYTQDKRDAHKDDISFTRRAKGDQKYSRFTPSLVVDYQVMDDVNIYAKAVSGYKAGGYNLRAGSVESFERGFGKETLNSYEAGVKSEWLDHRVRANVAVFRSDYDDIQVNIPLAVNPALTSTFNAGKARIDGVELDLTVVPLEGLLVNLSYAYLDAKYRSVVDPQTGLDITSSYALPMAPHNSYRVDAEYTFAPTPFGTLAASVDYSWQGKAYSQEDGPVSTGSYIKAYGLLGARLTLSDIAVGAGRFKASLWGRNLTDEEWELDVLGAFRGFVADRLVVYGPERSFGVDVTYEF